MNTSVNSRPQLDARLRCVEEHLRLENLHDLPGIMGTFGESPRYDVEPLGEHYVGREEVEAYYTELLQVLPDLQINVKERHVAAESIILEVVIRGTHSHAWRGIPATHRPIEFGLCAIYTFDRSNKLAGERVYYDAYGVLKQLGVIQA